MREICRAIYLECNYQQAKINLDYTAINYSRKDFLLDAVRNFGILVWSKI